MIGYLCSAGLVLVTVLMLTAVVGCVEEAWKIWKLHTTTLGENLLIGLIVLVMILAVILGVLLLLVHYEVLYKEHVQSVVWTLC